MIPLKNVLVATDFSEPSVAALSYGREFARQFHASLHVLHVVPIVAAIFAADMYSMIPPDLQDQVDADARRALDKVVTPEDRQLLHAKTVVLTSASPAVAIADYARAEGIDLIVMGTHGRTGLSHVLMGSVAERVVRTAPCPVLTLHHHERAAG